MYLAAKNTCFTCFVEDDTSIKWSSEPHESLSICRVKASLSRSHFLDVTQRLQGRLGKSTTLISQLLLKTLNIGPTMD